MFKFFERFNSIVRLVKNIKFILISISIPVIFTGGGWCMMFNSIIGASLLFIGSSALILIGRTYYNKLDNKVDELNNKLDNKVDELNNKLDNKVDEPQKIIFKDEFMPLKDAIAIFAEEIKPKTL